MVELLGRYSNWTSWAKQVRSIDRTGANRPETGPRSRRTARQLSEGEVTELVIRYRGGATVYDLAEQFKISRNTVSRHLHRGEIQMRRRSLSEQQVGVVIRLYEQGWSGARIGSHLGFNGGTVWLALRAQGVRMRDAQGRER
jgi:DNA-binding transcriptional ArsR family regulator